MVDFQEEELEIMEERVREDDSHKLSAAINIEDPIKTLNLRPVLRARETQSIREAIQLLDEKHMGSLVVDNARGETVGIFTERDLLKRILPKNLDPSREILKTHMTKNPETLSEDDPIAYALHKMSAGSYRHVPITKDGEVKYMLSVRDIVDYISYAYRQSVLNIPPDPHQTITEYGG